MQLDPGCAPNFNQRSSHFIFFFFNTQNSKLGQTSWNTALNYSHNLGKSLQSPMLQSPYLPKEENDGNHLRNYLIQLL